MEKKSLIFFTVLGAIVAGCTSSVKRGARIIYNDYSNGQNKTVFQFATDPASFDDNYYFEIFYPDGKLKLIGLKNRDVKLGEWKFYAPNGILKAKVNFKDDTLIGFLTLYNEAGRIDSKYMIKNGLVQNPGNRNDLEIERLQRQLNDLDFKCFEGFEDNIDSIFSKIPK